MVSLVLLLLSTALITKVQPLPAGYGGGRGLDMSVGGVRHQHPDLRKVLPYEDQMMSYPGGGAKDMYSQSDNWRGRSLEQALQRLVETDQRREREEEQRAVYLTALLRLLNEAQSLGLVGPGDVEVIEEEEEEEADQRPPGDFRDPGGPDYDETGRGLSMGRPPATWWGLLEPRLAQALMDRMEPQLVQVLEDRARQDQDLDQDQGGPGQNQDQAMLRHLVARILSSMGPQKNPPVNSPNRRARRDLSIKPVGSTHRRTRRSLDDVTPPSPSNGSPLLRVKRLEEEEKLRPPATALQRMKRIDTMATSEELIHGSRRRRRREVMTYDPQMLIDQIVEFMRE